MTIKIQTMKVSNIQIASILFVATFGFPFFSFSQSDNCSNLLQYGIYNTIKEQTNDSDYKQQMRKVCDILETANQQFDAGSSRASLSIPGVGIGGNKSYTREEISELKKIYCEETFEESDVKRFRSIYSRIISSDVLDSYLKCQELSKNSNLPYELNVTVTDPEFSHVTIAMRPVSKGRPKHPKLAPFQIDTTKFKIIEPALYEVAKKGGDLDQAYAIGLERIIRKPDNFIQVGDKKFLAPPSQIVIQMDNDIIPINIPAIALNTQPVYLRSPMIGEIITSVLEPDMFFQLYDKDEWMLANGDPIPSHASTLRELYGETVPDLRGVFLRGKNYGIDIARGNPEGDLANGKFQSDALKSHTHPLTNLNMSRDNLGPGRTRDENFNGAEFSSLQGGGRQKPNDLFKIEPVGELESRPKNVTVSFYIRIAVKQKEDNILPLSQK